MAKKTTNAKVPEPGNSTVSKPVTKPKKPAKAKAAKAAKAAKVVAPKVVTSGLRAQPVTKSAAASITDVDIALRAYYIAEKRQKLGIPGDSTSDWVEAERQLRAEAAKK